MINQISVFQFQASCDVRVQLINKAPFFCLKDVCLSLGIKNTSQLASQLDVKGISKTYTPTKGGKQELIFVNEPNLYRVIFRSNKKEAIDFQNWVFDEVLPTIRKTGSYSLTINAEQQQAIKQAVNERSYRTGEHHQAVYVKFYQHFKIPRYQDLPASKFDEAIKWLGGIHSRNGLSDEDWYDLAWLYKVADRMRSQIELIEPALRAIDSSFVSAFHSMSIEYKRNLHSAKLIIERETAHINAKNIIDKWNRVLPVIRHH